MSVTLRAASPDDEEFLYELFCQTMGSDFLDSTPRSATSSCVGNELLSIGIAFRALCVAEAASLWTVGDTVTDATTLLRRPTSKYRSGFQPS